MDQPREESIADQHARWIRFGSMGAAVLIALLVFTAARVFGLPYLPSAAISAASYLAAAMIFPRMIANAAARTFVGKYRTATLSVEPTAPDTDLESAASWFTSNGFVSHGSWKTVGADGVVYGSVGSWLFHRSDHAISAYIDRTQMAFYTTLSDGRVLVTTSVGAAPHPKVLIQGLRECEPAQLYELHGDGLRHLHAKGISAVEPLRGPVELRLQLDRYEQEHFNTMSVADGAVAIQTLITTPLGRISDEA